jgi:hypothetical protein
MKKMFVLFLLLSLIVVGCSPRGGVAFSPEQAAVQGAVAMMQNPGIIDQSSIVVRQTVSINDKTFVMVSYERSIEGRQEKCTSMHEVRKSPFGSWYSGSGGGGCSGQIGGPPEPLAGLEMGGGSSGSSSPTDPGYSYVYGLVHQEDIASARVTWDDETTMEGPVVNGSYIVIRTGTVQYRKVEGLNAEGEVVFGSELGIAPGKQP